jgi:hypothetical protein
MWHWFRRRSRTEDLRPLPSMEVMPMALQRLWWLADAPLFIVERVITGFYDALVRPEFELQGKTIGGISRVRIALL